MRPRRKIYPTASVQGLWLKMSQTRKEGAKKCIKTKGAAVRMSKENAEKAERKNLKIIKSKERDVKPKKGSKRKAPEPSEDEDFSPENSYEEQSSLSEPSFSESEGSMSESGHDEEHDNDDAEVCEEFSEELSDDEQNSDMKDDQAGNDADNTEESNEKAKNRSADRAEKKLLRLERKGARPGFDVVQEGKRIWNQIRPQELDSAKRQEGLAELFTILSGHFKEIVIKHDGSRIVQTCLKYGSTEQRHQIAKELSGSFPDTSKNKYGKHIVTKLLFYCPSMRESIISEFFGKVNRSLRNRDAGEVLDTIFKDYCNSKLRNQLVREFYGREYAIFKDSTASEGINALFKRVSSDKQTTILKNMETVIGEYVEKKALDRCIVHRLILEFVSHAPVKQVQALVSALSEDFSVLLGSADGSRAAIRLIALATSKERKAIVKSVKTNISQIVRNEHEIAALMALFHLVDDTVLLGKALIGELKEQIPVLFSEKVSRRLLFFLIGGVNGQYLSPQIVQSLREAAKDAEAAGTSKKNPEVRFSELHEQILPALESFLADNVSFAFSDLDKSHLAVEIIAGKPESEQASLLSTWIDRLGGPKEVFGNDTACEVIKRILKRTGQACSEHIFACMQDNLSSLMEGQAGFILIPMLRFPHICELIKSKFAKILVASSSTASTIVSSRLGLEPSATTNKKAKTK